ncbi:hypothetical protein ACFPYI_17650 [Halomarina salina]|uniref:Uncharacterized protein n=1 Tax=Halomarina salina TaxID=1872699 RepID=A0ABD5RRD1_9EURY|nr:hypothetical protein [Halomarina salina]
MPYAVRPTEAELSEARALVGVAIDACERVETVETPLRVALGWTDSEAVAEERMGVDGTTFPDGEVELAFNAATAGWDDAIGPVAAQQYGRVAFGDRVDVAFRWQRLLREAYADRLATETHPDGPYPWRASDDAALSERWGAIREELGERDDLPADRATTGVASRIGEELLDERDRSALLDLDCGAVREAGDAALH